MYRLVRLQAACVKWSAVWGAVTLTALQGKVRGLPWEGPWVEEGLRGLSWGLSGPRSQGVLQTS